MDLGLLTTAVADLALPVASQVLEPKSSITSSEEVEADAKVFKEKRAALLVSKKVSVREVPSGINATQVMLGSNLQFGPTMIGRYFGYGMCLRLY